MTWFNKARAARLVAGIAVAAVAGFGITAGTANAHWDQPHHGWHHGWSGGYYGAPPVVYGSPYGYGYYPPAAVYGPSVGINLPGVSIGIR
jgi:hypothetical protein